MLLGILVVYKPPGWEVSMQHLGSEVVGCLPEWLGEVLSSMSCPLPEAGGEHLIGFSHRLDGPSSGLLLVHLSCEAYCLLRWQLHMGVLVRDYFLPSYEHLEHKLCEIDAALFHCSGMGAVAGQGKLSQTSEAVVGHFSLRLVRCLSNLPLPFKSCSCWTWMYVSIQPLL